jgi:hypothetical protein
MLPSDREDADTERCRREYADRVLKAAIGLHEVGKITTAQLKKIINTAMPMRRGK